MTGPVRRPRVRRRLTGRSWAALALLVLCACTASPDVGARTTPSTASPLLATPPAPAGGSASATDLRQEKKAAGIADCPTSDADVPAVARGLPDVVLPCLGGGREVRLAGLRGRPMLVNVWAQWCGPCREEAPYLAEVAAGKPTELLVLGVDFVDPQPGLAVEFARQAGWEFAQVADPDKALAAPLQIVGPPQTFFVRADGTIAHRQSGPFTSADQIRRLASQHLGVDL